MNLSFSCLRFLIGEGIEDSLSLSSWITEAGACWRFFGGGCDDDGGSMSVASCGRLFRVGSDGEGVSAFIASS